MERFLSRLPDPVRSGLNTAVFSFLGLFLPSVLGWLSAASVAVDANKPLPGFSPLAKAALSAFIAVITGLLNTLWRYAQTKTGRGNPPTYRK